MVVGKQTQRGGERFSTGQRIGYVEAYLESCRAGSPSSPILPLWSLRALNNEYRHAGKTRMSELCTQLEAELIGLQSGTNADGLLNELSQIARSLRDAHRPAAAPHTELS